MKTLSEFKHFIGCDVSKSTLDFAVHERNKDYRDFQHLQVSNSREGFEQFRKWLRTLRISLKDSVIALEYTGGYSMEFTQWCHKKKYTFVMLHPLDVKNACSRGRNKTDKADSQFIADYVYTYREKLFPSEPEPPVITRLRQLRNARSLAVRTRASYQCQIKGVTDTQLLKLLNDMISRLSAEIKSIDQAIMKQINTNPEIKKNYDLLITIPGIGMVNALMTIVATSNFIRFQNSRQYAKFACVSPMAKESGSSVRGGAHVSQTGHTEIKSVLTEGARSAIHHDMQLKSYYTRKRTEGKSHGCVMNAVKFKLICRMFAVVKRQKPYVNTTKYLG